MRIFVNLRDCMWGLYVNGAHWTESERFRLRRCTSFPECDQGVG
jgi:hypothetical protein